MVVRLASRPSRTGPDRSEKDSRPRFFSRFSAKSKLYRYRIFAHTQRSALSRSKILHYPYPLDLDAIKAACCPLISTHDFSSFQGSPTDQENQVCTITRLTVDRFGGEVIFEVEGNRFLKQMARAIVGTLLEVGGGEAAGVRGGGDSRGEGPRPSRPHRPRARIIFGESGPLKRTGRG